MAQPSVHGRFIWQELMTDDTAGASEFYSRIIGWQVQSPAQPHGDYRMFAAGKHEVGGVMSLPEQAREAGARPHWLPYIGADDVDATVARIEQLGGKVLRAVTDVPDVGRYAVLADPQGAAFGIYHPRRPAPVPAGEPGRGEFAWQELATSDSEAAFQFYSQLFGWQLLERMDMGPAGTYLIFGRDGVRQGGIYKLSAQMPAPYWLSYISVGDVDAAVAEARGRGARVVNGPMDVPDGGRIAQMMDASGVLFAIHARTAAASPAAPEAPKRPAKRAPRAASATAPSAPAKPTPPASATEAAPAAAPSAPAAKTTPAKASPRPAAKSVGKVAKKAAKKKVAKKATKKAPKKTAARKAARKVARKTARKAVAKKGAKKPARKAARKAAGRAAARRGAKRPAARKSARKAAGKKARRGGRRR